MAIFKRNKTYYNQYYSQGRGYCEAMSLPQISVGEMGTYGQSAQPQNSPKRSVSQINKTGRADNALSHNVLHCLPS